MALESDLEYRAQEYAALVDQLAKAQRADEQHQLDTAIRWLSQLLNLPYEVVGKQLAERGAKENQ